MIRQTFGMRTPQYECLSNKPVVETVRQLFACLLAQDTIIRKSVRIHQSWETGSKPTQRTTHPGQFLPCSTLEHRRTVYTSAYTTSRDSSVSTVTMAQPERYGVRSLAGTKKPACDRSYTSTSPIRLHGDRYIFTFYTCICWETG